MKKLEEVQADISELSPKQQEQLCEWLENLLEDRLELKDEFKAEIEAGENNIAERCYPVRKP